MNVGRSGFATKRQITSANETVDAGCHATKSMTLMAGGGYKASSTVDEHNGVNVTAVALPGAFNDKEHMEMLQYRLDSMTKQFQNLREHYESKIEAQEKIHVGNSQVLQKKLAESAVLLRNITQQYEACQTKLTNLTRDYLRMRYDLQEREKTALEARTEADAELRHTQSELARLKEEYSRKLAELEKRHKMDLISSTTALKTEARHAVDHATLAERSTRDQLAQANATIAALRQELEKSRKRSVALEKRRQNDLEGFQRDVAAMVRAVRQLETQWALFGTFTEEAAMAATLEQNEIQDALTFLHEQEQNILSSARRNAQNSVVTSVTGAASPPPFPASHLSRTLEKQFVDNAEPHGSRAGKKGSPVASATAGIVATPWRSTHSLHQPPLVTGILAGYEPAKSNANQTTARVEPAVESTAAALKPQVPHTPDGHSARGSTSTPSADPRNYATQTLAGTSVAGLGSTTAGRGSSNALASVTSKSATQNPTNTPSRSPDISEHESTRLELLRNYEATQQRARRVLVKGGTISPTSRVPLGSNEIRSEDEFEVIDDDMDESSKVLRATLHSLQDRIKQLDSKAAKFGYPSVLKGTRL